MNVPYCSWSPGWPPCLASIWDMIEITGLSQAPLQNTMLPGKEGQLTLELPVIQPDSELPVVEFMLK